MKLAFLGTPEVAARTLNALVEAGHDVRAVVTRADTRRGRGGDASPSPVKRVALELGLAVVHAPGEALAFGADLGVVVAYGRLVKPDVLAQLPMVNIHFSLLPRWRGAAPVERSILAGDTVTGVCIMALEEGLDTGPVYARQEVAIGEEETAAELRQRLGDVGTGMLLRLLSADLPEPVPQEGEATYAAKLAMDELRLDFAAGARACHRVVRVGRAWTTFRGRRFLVHCAAVEASDGSGQVALGPGQVAGDRVGTGDADVHLRLLEVQPEGKPRMHGSDWARGARP
ncbi:MAG TPA: methionyl-tRNA formyltransferase, partial [Acidimicrobiales bacterium]|nr:methionyl-tRNA formyltransferase [Acidimicrobiales bacterium]